MTELLTVDLAPGWRETFSSFSDMEPFDANGERNYDVSEDLYQAELLGKDGSHLILDIGFYQTLYRVLLVKDYDWMSPVLSQTAVNRLDAKRIAEEISRTKTGGTT